MESPASRTPGSSRALSIVDESATSESLVGYTFHHSTYYRVMEGPDARVRTWYVILTGLRVGIVKDL